MAGELHQISTQIGRLQAEAESSREGRRVLHEKVDGLTRAVSDLASAVRDSTSRLEQVTVDMADIKPEVVKWRGLRHRAIGGLLAAGALSAGSGAALWEAVSKFLRGGN